MEVSSYYVDEKEVSRITGLSLSTLRAHRHYQKGIPFVKVGRAVRYSREDVVEFMESNKIQTEKV